MGLSCSALQHEHMFPTIPTKRSILIQNADKAFAEIGFSSNLLFLHAMRHVFFLNKLFVGCHNNVLQTKLEFLKWLILHQNMKPKRMLKDAIIANDLIMLHALLEGGYQQHLNTTLERAMRMGSKSTIELCCWYINPLKINNYYYDPRTNPTIPQSKRLFDFQYRSCPNDDERNALDVFQIYSALYHGLHQAMKNCFPMVLVNVIMDYCGAAWHDNESHGTNFFFTPFSFFFLVTGVNYHYDQFVQRCLSPNGVLYWEWYVFRDVQLHNFDAIQSWINHDPNGQELTSVVYQTSSVSFLEWRRCVYVASLDCPPHIQERKYKMSLFDLFECNDIRIFLPIIARNLKYFKRFYNNNLLRLSVKHWSVIYELQKKTNTN